MTLAMPSCTVNVPPDARTTPVIFESAAAWFALMVLLPVTSKVVAMATPPAFVAAKRLAALSATTSAAPDASEKFNMSAKKSACAAERVLFVPVNVTAVALAMA